jgi:hypothetical protein
MSPVSRLARWLMVFPALAMAATIGACDGDRPSKKDCSALLDKIIELEIAAAGTSHLSPDMKADLDKQRKTMREFLRDPFMKQCRNELHAEVVACRLKAKSQVELAACETL